MRYFAPPCIINVDGLVSSSTARLSKLFSLHLCEILMLLKCKTLRTEIHTAVT